MTKGDKLKLGSLLQKLRLERQLSISELASKAGLSKGYLSQLERGDASNPSMEALRKLASALDVALSVFLGEETESGKESYRLPKSLLAFAEKAREQGKPVTAKDLEMLSRVQYRGRHPSKPEDWAYLYETIKRIIK